MRDPSVSLTITLRDHQLSEPEEAIEGELVGEVEDIGLDAGEVAWVVAVCEGVDDPGCNLLHLRFFHAAGGEGGGAEADAGGLEGWVGVVGDGVFVDGDAGLAEGVFGFRAEHAFFKDIDEHEMGVGATGDDAEAFVCDGGGEGAGVGNDLVGVDAEFGLKGLAEGDGFGGDDVHEWTALLAGKDAAVDAGCELLGGEDEAGARAAEGFVRGGGGDVSVWDGRRVSPTGNQTGEVGHIDHKIGADLIGDLAHAGEVEVAGVGAAAADDDLWLFAGGDVFDLVVVEGLGILPDLVTADAVELAREV